MQGMAPGKVLGNKKCSRHLDTVCGWVCRTAMEECEMKLLELTIQGFVDLVEAFGFYPKSTRDGAGVGEGGDLMIFILKSARELPGISKNFRQTFLLLTPHCSRE